MKLAFVALAGLSFGFWQNDANAGIFASILMMWIDITVMQVTLRFTSYSKVSKHLDEIIDRVDKHIEDSCGK